MRILMLSNVPLEERLGSAYVTLGFAKGLRERGHCVELVGPEVLECFKFLRRGKLQRLAWGARSYVARHAAKGVFDVVELWGGQHCHAAHFLSRIRDRQFLVVAHSNGIEMHGADVIAAGLGEQKKEHALWKRIKRAWDLPVERMFREVDGIVTVSRYDLEYARLNALKAPARLKAIENSLPAAFIGLQVRFEREPVIGFIAPWKPLKGMAAIREALPGVMRRFANVRLLLIGVGGGFRKEEEFPADICKRVEVIGPLIDRAELRNQYGRMSILIMPSIYEGFGMVASEAMACGCAVVATRTGFLASVIDGEEALLLERSEGVQLAAAVSRLLLDERLRQRIAKNGWKRVQGLCWDRAVEQLECTYLQWLGEVRQKKLKGEV